MQLSVRSMLATGVSVTAAATIVLAPLPTDVSPLTRTAPVVLTGAWQDLADNTNTDLANLRTLITTYPFAPILSQIGRNLTTYSHWLGGQDGGTPLKIVETITNHATAVATTVVTYAILTPLSFIGPFIAPGVMLANLVGATATYPSTPQTVLQAFIDAPAVYLNTTLNCCSSPFFDLAFGLLNPGPLGYLLTFAPAIAADLQIATPETVPSGSAVKETDEPAPPAAARQAAAASGSGQSRRTQSTTAPQKGVASRSAKRLGADRKAADVSVRETTSSPGKGQSGRSVRPGNPGTR